jgi:hypothetical protein
MPSLAELTDDLHEGDVLRVGELTVTYLYRDTGASVCQGSC